MMFSNFDVRQQLVFRQVLIASKTYLTHPVPFALVNLVQQRDLVRLVLYDCLDLGIEVAFLLKEIDQIATALLHQVTIECSFVVNRDQLLLSSAAKEGKQREMGASGADVDDRSFFHVKRNVRAVGLCMILRWIHPNPAGQTALPRQIFLQPAGGRL